MRSYAPPGLDRCRRFPRLAPWASMRRPVSVKHILKNLDLYREGRSTTNGRRIFGLGIAQPAIPSSLKSAPIGAGPRQGRALRPEGASEPKGSLDGWLRWNTMVEEGMAGAPAAVPYHRAAGFAILLFVRPVRPASIRTLGEPLRLVPVGVLDYFRVLPSK